MNDKEDINKKITKLKKIKSEGFKGFSSDKKMYINMELMLLENVYKSVISGVTGFSAAH